MKSTTATPTAAALADADTPAGAAAPATVKERAGVCTDTPTMSKAERIKAVEKLRQRDNTTNFYYIAQVYCVLIGTPVLTIWSYTLVAQAGLGWWWNIPATILAIIVTGATQHQLGGITHEATHHILFKNRRINELASDWLAAFPIFTTTHSFRLHHLAHHQFVNDPKRDPNFEMADEAGYWLDFPVEHIEFLAGAARLLWPPNLFSYIKARLRQSTLGGGHNNPYADNQDNGNQTPIAVGVAFTLLTPFLIFPFQLYKMYLAATLVLVGLTAACLIYYALAPKRVFKTSRIDPVVSHRATQINRTIFTALLYGFLTLTEYATGHPTWIYYVLLWIVPVFTTFPIFMIVREWLQHGNADRGRYTNSRIMLFNPLTRYAIMPWGMDYHLPHHLMAVVPHYNLKKFHELLLATDSNYAQNAQIVEGWTRHKDAGLPTMVEVLGPRYAPPGQDIHVAADVLQYSDVNDAEGISKQEAASREGA